MQAARLQEAMDETAVKLVVTNVRTLFLLVIIPRNPARSASRTLVMKTSRSHRAVPSPTACSMVSPAQLTSHQFLV